VVVHGQYIPISCPTKGSILESKKGLGHLRRCVSPDTHPVGYRLELERKQMRLRSALGWSITWTWLCCRTFAILPFAKRRQRVRNSQVRLVGRQASARWGRNHAASASFHAQRCGTMVKTSQVRLFDQKIYGPSGMAWAFVGVCAHVALWHTDGTFTLGK
jgi:hypothetical protein